MALTEFEKTILLSLFALAKGSSRRHVSQELLLSKFPIRQRKIVRYYIGKLTREKFLVKHKSKESYKVGRKALKQISIFLVQGPKMRL